MLVQDTNVFLDEDCNKDVRMPVMLGKLEESTNIRISCSDALLAGGQTPFQPRSRTIARYFCTFYDGGKIARSETRTGV